MKKFVILSIVLLMLAGFAITSSAAVTWVDLLADQDIVVGRLMVNARDDLQCFFIVYNTATTEWELLETHLYVGYEKPTKSAPGQFPYGPEDVFLVPIPNNVVGYKIPYGDVIGDSTGDGIEIYIAAHAKVQKPIVDEFGVPILDEDGNPTYQEETAWAEGDESIPIPPGRNWATYFTIVVVVPE